MATTPNMRATAGFGTAFRQQVWLLGMSSRWLYLAAGPLAVLVLIWAHGIFPQGVIVVTGILTLVASSIWPVMVWYGEGPYRRSYHWTFPVARPAQDLARVAAGAMWLIVVCAILAGVALVADKLNGTIDLAPASVLSILYGPKAWFYFFAAPLITYLLVSPLALWSDYRITRWILGAWIVMTMIGAFLATRGITGPIVLVDTLFFAENWGIAVAVLSGIERSMTAAIDGTATGMEWRAMALWFAVGLALTAAATFRPDDFRKAISSRRQSLS